MELPKYTAYAKMLQETDGTQTVWKGKIQTLKLAPGPEDVLTRKVIECRRAVINLQTGEYLKWRDRIAEEITRRQVSWRTKVVDEPPAARGESKTGIVDVRNIELPIGLRFMSSATITKVKAPAVEAEDEPPPSHS